MKAIKRFFTGLGMFALSFSIYSQTGPVTATPSSPGDFAVGVVVLSNSFVSAEEQSCIASNSIFQFGGFSAVMETNGNYRFVNPQEFWRGVWKEDTNGWRVQLSFTNSYDGLLTVQWGSVVKNSGGGYLRTPDGKFAKFQLRGPNGNIIPPRKGVGTNLLGGIFVFGGYGITYAPWSSNSNSLEEEFPKRISTNLYPHSASGELAGYIWASKDYPPDRLNQLKLYNLFSITNEGDYTLTVQPVLYRQYFPPSNNVLERVDLPCVTTKIHLVPNVK